MGDDPTTKAAGSARADLERKISFCTSVAWLCVMLGAAAALAGFLVFLGKDEPGTWLAKLSLLGSYLQGAVASIWSLAGLLFIYVAFLGQRQQLLGQDLELQHQKQQFEAQQGVAHAHFRS